MKKSLAFTLAEVLITLAIIGVVAAMTIPSVIVNTNQQEFKTGLRKAISVLNSSITMNLALEGESPYDNENLFEYLQQHMSVMKSTTTMPWNVKHSFSDDSTGEAGYQNYAFYTTDGMRFEVPHVTITKHIHEGNGTATTVTFNTVTDNYAGKCGTSGYVADSPTHNAPCLILVDVNGDRKPTPSKTPAADAEDKNVDYVYPAVGDKLLKDIFSVIITDEKAIPYGVIAQKAMYQANEKK